MSIFRGFPIIRAKRLRRNNRNEHPDADGSFEAVPKKARKGFLPLFFIRLGFTLFCAGMSVGAKLGNGPDLGGFVWTGMFFTG